MHDQQVTVSGPSSPNGHGWPGARLSVLLLVGVAVVVWIVLVRMLGSWQDPAPEAPAAHEVAAPPASGVNPFLEEGLAVGDTARLLEGAVARINSLESGVTLDPGLPAPEPGMRLDRLDVELCAGSTELFVDAAFWLGLGDDGNVHSANMGVRDLVTMTLAPGTCQRGSVDLALPEQVDLDAVLLADTERTTAARWSVGDSPQGAVEPQSPLRSETTPVTTAMGSPATPSTGGSVTLHEVVTDDVSDGAAPPDPGTTLVRIDGERCADEQPLPASPRHWFVQLEDQRLVAPERETATMQTDDLDPGACDRGTADFLVPTGTDVVAVIYTYGAIYEEARWVVDP